MNFKGIELRNCLQNLTVSILSRERIKIFKFRYLFYCNYSAYSKTSLRAAFPVKNTGQVCEAVSLYYGGDCFSSSAASQ